MKSSKQLYFIALLPPEAIAAEVHSIKEEIAAKYASRYSLKIPEHITLIPPFHCSVELLELLNAQLKNLCHEKKPFEVFLKDFGNFGKSVLFIQASSQPTDALERLHNDVAKMFSVEVPTIKFPQSGEKFTPHLTIANKDLTKPSFKKAWEEFRQRNFEAAFTVNSIYILKHVEGIWRREKEIPFGK